ncbi:hypothetical protein [Bradyrhizobium sp. C9]|uniref:hypothetical protein n=1 Tax=Bradyrhizobium sp. C9 TaxID=142585 RepID=UPI000BE7CB9E|nr:hypothetical protein [Bradyrhizobium sp. C9]PDT74998.1 hypothetical protein CO675_22130 [Bradyrhizobium sp. C9]
MRIRYQKKMVVNGENWRTRSLLSRFAHIVERTGLALAGGSCGLFVAAYTARSDFGLIGSDGVIAVVMMYGAAGYYLGIDLPPAPKLIRELSPRGFGSRADAVEVLSAAGTFLTAIMAVIAVSSIILDEVARPQGARAEFWGWVFGASMQIAAGIIARTRTHIS